MPPSNKLKRRAAAQQKAAETAKAFLHFNNMLIPGAPVGGLPGNSSTLPIMTPQPTTTSTTPGGADLRVGVWAFDHQQNLGGAKHDQAAATHRQGHQVPTTPVVRPNVSQHTSSSPVGAPIPPQPILPNSPTQGNASRVRKPKSCSPISTPPPVTAVFSPHHVTGTGRMKEEVGDGSRNAPAVIFSGQPMCTVFHEDAEGNPTAYCTTEPLLNLQLPGRFMTSSSILPTTTTAKDADGDDAVTTRVVGVPRDSTIQQVSLWQEATFLNTATAGGTQQEYSVALNDAEDSYYTGATDEEESSVENPSGFGSGAMMVPRQSQAFNDQLWTALDNVIHQLRPSLQESKVEDVLVSSEILLAALKDECLRCLSAAALKAGCGGELLLEVAIESGVISRRPGSENFIILPIPVHG